MSEPEKKPIFTSIFLPSKCPNCNKPLKPIRVLLSDWPYIHCDVELHCCLCEFKALYGVPLDKLAGLGLQIYDSHPSKAIKKANLLREPKCPFHNVTMVMTKIFGNKVFKNDRIRVQFKCPQCFLTAHETV